ncbi:MAG: HEPN/Toprim-associated domain-containing protein [Eubacterium sp.]|nr:HEPN/Toprim-associated domain-containing protein [Eubacterium sp.]
MGEYVSLTIGKADFLSRKNSFGELLLLFSPADIHFEDVEYNDGEKGVRRYFKTTVCKAKRGLDVLNHTYQDARILFEANKQEYIEYSEEYDDSFDLEYVQNNYKFEEWVKAIKKYAHEMAFLETDSYREWYEYFKGKSNKTYPLMEQIVVNSLPYFNDDTYFGMNIEFGSVWDVFRVILDAFDNEQEIILDYTNLYEGGWCEDIPSSDLFDVEKTIILTEGKFDTYVIRESMKILYPDMVKYFSFIDFSEYAVPGSTSYLCHYLRAFIAAKINNKIIALFDNDTAGMVAIKSLENIKLPPNVRVMHLPNLDLCSNYPTIGPIRNENTNINGKACSIEMFLGQDILKVNGKYEPVLWKGYEDKMKTYQGEIVNKKCVEDKFREKIKRISCGEDIKPEEWYECQMLLEQIFKAFCKSIH